MTESQKHKIKETLSKLTTNPNKYPGVKNMAGEWAGYMRIKTGNVRIMNYIITSSQIKGVE